MPDSPSRPGTPGNEPGPDGFALRVRLASGIEIEAVARPVADGLLLEGVVLAPGCETELLIGPPAIPAGTSVRLGAVVLGPRPGGVVMGLRGPRGGARLLLDYILQRRARAVPLSAAM